MTSSRDISKDDGQVYDLEDDVNGLTDLSKKRKQKASSEGDNREETLPDELTTAFDDLINPDTELKDKFTCLNSLQKETLPTLFKELKARNPNIDRSVVASRALIALRDIQKSLVEQRSLEIKEELDPNNPKFQLVFQWFMEIIHDVMVDEKFDGIQINNFFHSLQGRLVGWEDKVSKSLKGLSIKALSNVSNPIKTLQEYSSQDRTGHEEAKSGGIEFEEDKNDEFPG